MIAAALGEQGVYEGRDGRAISADRLIALVRHIEVRHERAVARQAEKAGQSDLTPVPPSPPQPASSHPPARSRLAPELQPRPAIAPEDEPLSEAEISRLQAEKHSHLFKKG